MDATHSAVIVPVPAAEPVVGAHRARLDRAATWGVPAHVTVVFPFAPPAALDEATLERLAAAVATVPRATVAFDGTDWFGTDVLWLAPRPAEVFHALTEAVTAAFPRHRPYDGRYDEVVPHLTVGHDHPHADLLRAEEAVRPLLPFTAEVAGAALWVGTDRPGRLVTGPGAPARLSTTRPTPSGTPRTALRR
ncbi:2'-5' RNA ligase family protein [Nocardioides sp. W3-2-3]|nr:2'-5' RNA ligase family protein [Nocardioides convexus]